MSDPRLFIKLHNGFPEHPKTVGLSDKAFRGLIELWCYCSRNLTDGIIQKSAIPRIIPPKTVRELAAAGYLIDNGSTVEMHDYLEHQQSAQKVSEVRERRKEAGRKGGEAKAKRLANASDVAKQTASKNVADTDPDTDKELKRTPSSTGKPSKEFEEFWKTYPRKVGKGAAIKAHAKALRTATHQQILTGVENLRIEVAGKDPQFTPHPSTWLNEMRWEDETPTTHGQLISGPWSKEYHQ